jgi:large subunit ribosomal protein L30
MADSRPAQGADTRIRVTQIRSGIGSKPKHRGTLRALGLRGVGQTNVLPDRPEIRGMIARVPHLITVEATEEAFVPAMTRSSRVPSPVSESESTEASS